MWYGFGKTIMDMCVIRLPDHTSTSDSWCRLSEEQANEISDVLTKVCTPVPFLFDPLTFCLQRLSERVSLRSSIKLSILLPLVQLGVGAPVAIRRKLFGKDLTLPSVIVSVTTFQHLLMSL